LHLLPGRGGYGRATPAFRQEQRLTRRRFGQRASLHVELLESRYLLNGDIHSIQHVIVIMQENRSFDTYFGTYPGANGIPMQNGVPTVSVFNPVTGQMVAPYHDTLDRDIVDNPHGYADAIADINGGQMNGFLHALQPGQAPQAMGYHTQQDIPNYWSYAQNFVLQDRMFEPVAGWSLPAHLLMVSGWSASCSDPTNPMSCVNDPVQGAAHEAQLANDNSKLYAWTDLTYLMNKYNVSWNYFTDVGNQNVDNDEQVAPGIWNPLPHFTDVQQDNQVSNVTSSATFFADAAAGTLPNVSWVVPNQRDSEHSPALISDGQAWTTSLINAVMQGPDWSSSAIFLAWDDWGGYYDHVTPPVIDGNGFGLRVPGLMISPYAKQGLIDHQTLSFDSYLAFIENDFMNGQRLDPATDGRPDPRTTVVENLPGLGDLLNEFDFNQAPLAPVILPLRPNGPTASAGGPYAIAEGQSLTLDASQTIDPRGLPMTFKWDLTGSGVFNSALGMQPTLTWQQLQALGLTENGGPYQISVDAIDSAGWENVSPFTTLTIQSVAPSTTISGGNAVTEGVVYSLTLTPSFFGDGQGYTVTWGDGTTTTVNGLPPRTSHTYADWGNYTVSATVLDDGATYPAANTLALLVRDASISPIAQSFTPAEGQPFTGVVAEFLDPGSDGSTVQYSNSINWGDGHSGSGTVFIAGPNTIGVSATHTYAKAGLYGLYVKLTDAGGKNSGFTSTVTVVPAVLSAASSLPAPVEGTAFTGTIVTFTDPLGKLSNFSASIAWGNGATSPGIITNPSSGTYAIAGSNSYAEDGPYTVTVALTKNGAAAGSIQVALVVADAPLQATAQSISPVEGTAFSGVVAAFRDPGSDGSINDYSASITWGDGQVSTGVLTASGNNNFTVSGSNTYALAGSYPVTVVIQDQGGANAIVTPQATVQDAPLQPTSKSIAPTTGTAFSGVVAAFRDPGSNGNLGAYSATISWGDGHNSPGTISGSAGTGFNVSGTNTYGTAKTYSISVTISDVGGANSTVTSTAVVTNVGITANTKSFKVWEGTAFTGVVANFGDIRSTAASANYTATIAWGDGKTTAGVVAYAGVVNGTTWFSVTGSYTYVEEGTYPLSVTIVDTAVSGNPSVTTYGTLTSFDAALTGYTRTVAPFEGVPFTGIVAAFRDADPNGTAADYSATITWGNGSTSAGTIGPDGYGGLAVTGSTTFASIGAYPISVVIQDLGGASVTVNSEANVTDAPLTGTVVPFSPVEETRFTGIVATFSDSDPQGILGDYTATITWGDGKTSAGTIVIDPTGGFDVEAAHTYTVDGNYTITATITDVGGAVVTLNGSITAYDQPLAPEAAAGAYGQLGALVIATPTEGQSFSGEVALFTDPGTDGVTNDYQVTINWGDGTTSVGTTVPDPAGSNRFDIFGTHTYTSTGSYFTNCTVLDPGPNSPPNQQMYFGAAQVLAAPLTTTPAAFTAVEGAAFTGSVATFTSANPNATATEYSATISWGDGQSSAGTVQENSNGVFSVGGTHAYADQPSAPINIIIDEYGYYVAAAQTTAVVSDAPLVASATPVAALEAASFSGEVATFVDANPYAPLTDFPLGNITIAWGDGATSTATAITQDASGTFHVIGTHTYAVLGPTAGPLMVTITDIDGAISNTTSYAPTIGPAPLTINTSAVTAVEGIAFTATLATFTSANQNATPAEYSATVAWGDGQSSTATIVEDSNAIFSVVATHIYAEGASDPISIVVNEYSYLAATIQTTASVSDAPLTAAATPVTAWQAVPFSGEVATFVDANPYAPLTDFPLGKAVISWGDGTSSTATAITQDAQGTFHVFGSHTYSARLTAQLLTVTITDVDGAVSNTTNYSLTVLQPLSLGPLALTPNPVNVGATTQLSGTISEDPSLAGGAHSIVIDWGDGSAKTTVNLPAGVLSFSIGHAYLANLPSNPTYTVNVTASNSYPESASGSTSVTVNHVPPTVTISGASGGVRGEPRMFIFSAIDASPIDQAAGFTFQISWGDGSNQTITGVQTTSPTHTYVACGTYKLRVTATDEDGSVSAVATNSIVIKAVQLQPDSVTAGLTALAVGGTTGTDAIVVQPVDTQGTLQVTINGVVQGSYSPSPGSHLLVFGQAGNDTITVASNTIQGQTVYVGVPAMLFGGTGNVVLDARGSNANNLLEGAGGNDLLYGGLGRDVLIGGQGASTLTAGSGDDILIAGSTNYDTNLSALGAILAEWSRTDADYTTRIGHLKGTLTGGLNGSTFLTAAKVHKGNAADTIFGDAANDWFFARQTGANADTIYGWRQPEVITAI
jgi:phospholipase C